MKTPTADCFNFPGFFSFVRVFFSIYSVSWLVSRSHFNGCVRCQENASLTLNPPEVWARTFCRKKLEFSSFESSTGNGNTSLSLHFSFPEPFVFFICQIASDSVKIQITKCYGGYWERLIARQQKSLVIGEQSIIADWLWRTAHWKHLEISLSLLNAKRCSPANTYTENFRSGKP